MKHMPWVVQILQLRRTRRLRGTVWWYGVSMLLLLLALAGCDAAGSTTGSSSRSNTTGIPPASATPSPTPAGLRAWTTLGNLPRNPRDVAFVASNPATAYLCAADGPAAAPLPNTPSLYKSTDGERTWQRLANTPVLHPVASTYLHPVTECGITVNQADANDLLLQESEVDPSGAGYAIARVLFRSRNAGTSWQPLTTMQNTDGFGEILVVGSRLVTTFLPSDHGASGCDPSTAPKPTPTSTLVASDDGGMSWHDLGRGIESQGYSPRFVTMAGTFLFVIADKVPDSPCGAMPTSALWRSSDGGNTWSIVSTSSPGTALGPLSFAGKGSGSGAYGVMLSAGGQVLYSRDSGATWAALTAMPQSHIWVQLLVTPNGDLLVNAGDGDYVYRLRPTDSVPSWKAFAPGTMNWSQVVRNQNGSETLWSFDFAFNSSGSIAYMVLP